MQHPALDDDLPALPSLDPGVTLLESPDRATGALQSLVLDHLLLADGRARWIDSRSNARTVQLTRVAPTGDVLERVLVARAFTAYQHHSLVDDVADLVGDGTALLVVPAVEWFYGEADLRRGEGEAMLRDALERLADLARAHDIPAVVTRAAADGVGAVVPEYVDRRVRCELTAFGPRFAGEDFETLVYRRPGGVQTTLAFWRRVLERRHAAPAAAAREVGARGAH